MDETTNGSSSPSKEELERKKLSIEIEKITLEKEELEKIWPKRLQKWSYVLPSIIGILAFITALSTGYLNAASAANKDENILLQIQTKELEAKKVTLNHESDSLKQVVQNEKDTFQSERKKLADTIGLLQGKITFYKVDLEKLLKGAQTTNEKINILQTTLGNMYATKKYLELKIDSLNNYIDYNHHAWANYQQDLMQYSTRADHYQDLAEKLRDSLDKCRGRK